jgi:hypothetical protein
MNDRSVGVLNSPRSLFYAGASVDTLPAIEPPLSTRARRQDMTSLSWIGLEATHTTPTSSATTTAAAQPGSASQNKKRAGKTATYRGDLGDFELRWTKLSRVVNKIDGNGRSYVSTEEYWGLALWASGYGEKKILEGSRDQRIAALDALPALIAQLTAEARERADRIKNAKRLLK